MKLPDIPFFILAGGRGIRARPLSDYKPKPLFPLNGTPLLEIILDQIEGKGLRQGFINLHYKAGDIDALLGRRAGIRRFYEESLSGSRILQASLDYLEEFLLVINGDVFLDIPVEKMWDRMKNLNADGLLLVRPSRDKGYAHLVIDGDIFKGRAKDTGRKETGFMYTGVALFRKKVVAEIRDVSFFDSLKGSDFKIGVLPYEGPWLDLGTPELYFGADSTYHEYGGTPGTNSLSPHVSISPRSTVRESILWEHTVVSGRSLISQCIVTGHLNLHNVSHHRCIITPGGVYELDARSRSGFTACGPPVE